MWPHKTMVHRTLAPLGKKGTVSWSLLLSTGQVARQESEKRRGPQTVLVTKAEARARRKDTTVWQERIDQLPLDGGGMFIT